MFTPGFFLVSRVMFCLRDPFSLKAGGRRKRRMRENEVEKWTIITIPGSLYKEAKKWRKPGAAQLRSSLSRQLKRRLKRKRRREKNKPHLSPFSFFCSYDLFGLCISLCQECFCSYTAVATVHEAGAPQHKGQPGSLGKSPIIRPKHLKNM